MTSLLRQTETSTTTSHRRGGNLKQPQTQHHSFGKLQETKQRCTKLGTTQSAGRNSVPTVACESSLVIVVLTSAPVFPSSLSVNPEPSSMGGIGSQRQTQAHRQTSSPSPSTLLTALVLTSQSSFPERIKPSSHQDKDPHKATIIRPNAFHPRWDK